MIRLKALHYVDVESSKVGSALRKQVLEFILDLEMMQAGSFDGDKLSSSTDQGCQTSTLAMQSLLSLVGLRGLSNLSSSGQLSLMRTASEGKGRSNVAPLWDLPLPVHKRTIQ